MNNKLHKSKTDKVLAGVIGGLGEHFNLDPTLLRLAYAFIAVFTAIIPGIVFYILAALIVPEKPTASHPPAGV